MQRVLCALFQSGLPIEHSKRVEITSGGTAYGGVEAMYSVANELGIRTNGLMSGKGLVLPWSQVDRMVYVGSEWGDESPAFVRSSDVVLAFSGGNQAKEEIQKAALSGKSVIALYDGHTKGATLELFEAGYRHPNVHYFHTGKIGDASNFLKETIRSTAARKPPFIDE